MATLCLGEVLVDLVCERPVRGLAEADAFVPRFGGAVANAAVMAARRGGEVALAGGAGADAWGRWLRSRLEEERVGLEFFALVEGPPTAVAFVAVDEDGEPDFLIYGDGIGATVQAVGSRLEEAVQRCDGVFFSSNTLAGEAERELTMRAREMALERGRPVLFDPNLRMHRWSSPSAAAAAARECVSGALMVRTNRSEAELITGERDPAASAQALVDAGARTAVVTLGAQGALARGEVSTEAPGLPADVVNTTGAGDVLTGVLIAALQRSGYDPTAIAAALPDAVAESARATERWGALE